MNARKAEEFIKSQAAQKAETAILKGTVYNLMKDSVEIDYKRRAQIAEGVAVDSECGAEIVKTFATETEALKALNEYSTEVRELSSSAGAYYLVTEYYIEEAIYDDEGEWIDGGDVIAHTPLKVAVYDDETDEVIGTFNNYRDAERAANECTNCTDIKFN